MIIYPDRNGFLNIKHNDTFKLACIDKEFSWPFRLGVTELMVTCLNETFVEYRRQKYPFEKFKCKNMPVSKFVVTLKKCQNKNTTFVARVGFQTRRSFLNVYRVCFDTRNKNPLYTWYQLTAPKSYRFQATNWSGVLSKQFYKTKSYGNMSVNSLYVNQVSTYIKLKYFVIFLQ